MPAVIPFQAAFQVARYARLGHTDLFTRKGTIECGSIASASCTLVEGNGSQEFLLDSELPAGSDREDVERVLRQLSRDLRDGTLMIVSPNAEQLQQIKADGIQLHQARLDVLLAALDHVAHHHLRLDTGLTAHQLRNGFLVVIKTN